MEKMTVNAVFRLSKEDFPERKRSTIVITDDGNDVHVAVKALARVFEKDEAGNLTAREEQWGNICTLHKDAPIGCIFASLNELFETVPEIIDNTKKDVKA